MRGIVVWLMMAGILCASSPKVPFHTLAEPLEQSVLPVEKLSDLGAMEQHRPLLKNFVAKMRSAWALGRELSGQKRPEAEPLNGYLMQLRELARMKETIDAAYRKSLFTAIEAQDKYSFERLVAVPLEPLHHPRVRSDVIAFYQKNFPPKAIPAIETLREEEELETKSLQIAIEQEQAYEEHLRTLKRSEVARVKKTAQIGSRNSVILSAESNGAGGFEFEAENLNPYTVTLSIDFESIHNLRPSAPLPYFIEIPGKSRKKVLNLSRIASGERVDYRSTYGWVRGSPFAVHNDAYPYTLPFKKETSVYVSQGYHGGLTHKGLSAYAIDFPVPVGTPIHAAREGTVVGAEGGNNLGGMSPEYRRYANYVIIEHSDGTMGNYYHLKEGGAAVSIGQKVARGDLIGYSGNTGYTSGPHLHFSVSKVDPVSMRRPMNLPIRIETKEGLVTLPRKGDRYTVQ